MSKKHHKLEDLLHGFEPKIKVPTGLSVKIMRKMDKRTKAYERRQIILSGVIAFVALAVSFYGLTGLVVNSIESEILTYLSQLLQAPSLLFSSIGFRAFVERLPVISLLLFLGASGLTVRSLVKIIRINSHIEHEILAH